MLIDDDSAVDDPLDGRFEHDAMHIADDNHGQANIYSSSLQLY